MKKLALQLIVVALLAGPLVSTALAQQGGGPSARQARKNGERQQKAAQKRAKQAQRSAQQRQKDAAKNIKRQHKDRQLEIKRKTKERKQQGHEVESQVQQTQPDAPPKRRARPSVDGPTDPLEQLRQYGNTGDNSE